MSSIARTPQARIDSWKGVAAFLRRDERTVQRWEKERGLPVYRVPGRRGAVFAYESELQAWLQSAPPPGSGVLDATEDADRSRMPDAGRDGSAHRYTPWLAAAAIMLVIGAFGAIWRVRSTKAQRATAAASSSEAAADTTVSAAAHAAYLQGVFNWSRRTPAGLDKALAAFSDAIRQDDRYAAAYVGIAETYELMPEFGNMAAGEAYRRATPYAQRAVALQPNSADAHRVLAFALFYGEWRERSAFAEFRRSIELDKRNAESHHWFANALFTVRELPEAHAEIQRARDLDPNSAAILADSFMIDSEMPGMTSSSIQGWTELERTDPGFSSPPRYLAQVFLDNERYEAFVAALQHIATVTGSAADVALAQTATRAWRNGGTHSLLAALQRVEANRFRANQTSGYALALASFRAGDRADAMTYLNAAYRQHDFMVLTVLGKQDPVNQGLRALPGFDELRQKIEAQLQQ